jgi:hypothetical protein
VAVAYKSVTADWKSPGRDPNFHGWLEFSDDEWALLQLDYTIGTTVTPDPDVETAVKLASPIYSKHVLGWVHFPNGTNGIYAFAHDDGQSLLPATVANGMGPRDGHIVELTYNDPDDLIYSSVQAGSGCRLVQLRSAYVVKAVNGMGQDV